MTIKGDATKNKLCSAAHIIKTHWPNRLRDSLLAQKALLETGDDAIKVKIAIHAEEQEAGKAQQKIALSNPDGSMRPVQPIVVTDKETKTLIESLRSGKVKR
jgi:hypothetical protein